jgi:single-strand DNA-binding protein
MATRSVNKVILIGNVVRDPELRYTPQNTAVCTFSIATNRSWKTSEGNDQESTEFHRVVTWGKLAEIANQILAKGRKVYVEGRLQTREWDGQDGTKQRRTEIVAEQMVALDSRGAGAGQGDSEGGGDYSYPEGKPAAAKGKYSKPKQQDEELKVDDNVGAEESSVDDIADDIPF